MGLDPQLKAQLNQAVVIAIPATLDIAGQVSTVSAATFLARVEPYYREIMVGGVVEKTTHMLILSDAVGSAITEIQMRSAQIWLPNQTAAVDARRAKTVHYCYDEFGALDHLELLL